MRLLRLLFVLLSPMLFFACSKEKSFEKGTAAAQWEFQEGSNQFKGKVDTAYVVELGGGFKGFQFQGTSDDGTGLLSIGISGLNITAPGVYKTPNVQFDYVKSTGVLYENDLTATDQFVVEITAIDSASITGIFSGKVKDSSGADKTITNGKFTAKIVISGGGQPGTGQLTFWSKSSCTAGGPVSVKLSNNQTGSITTFTATAPNCGAAGTASFDLTAGTYSWVAKCGATDSITGVVTIAANQCVKNELIFGTPPANGQATFWAKNSCTAGGNITVRLSNAQTGTISSFIAAAPATCAVAGNANFTLPAGSYTWVAKCGPTDSVTGNLSVTASQCSKVEVVFATGTAAQYTLVSSGGNCSNFQVNGTYITAKPLGDTNNVVVQVNVTAIGSYSITTNNVNGYSFSATGNFTAIGPQTVTLRAVGTPVTAGTNNFTVTAGASTCGFPVTVINPPPTSATLNTWSFTQGTKNYSGTFPAGSDFGDDFLGFGKALDMYGEIPNTDTILNLYIQFATSPTQPVPGSYTTNPDLFNPNTTDLVMFDTNDAIFYVKEFPPVPPTTPTLTIILTSYDATTKIAKGTFSGTAWNTAGTIVPITNGKFEVEVIF
ncbi:MAG: hypothetical protein WCF67_23160 [Chitinophagaceae bacterium]